MLSAEKKAMKLFESIGMSQGLDKLTSDIFTIVFLEPDPICLDILSQKTGYSLASISNKVKFLEKVGVMYKERHPGCKKVFVGMEKNMDKMVLDQLRKKREIETKLAINKLPKIIKEFKKESKTEKDKEKIKLLQNYYKQTKKFDLLIKKMIETLENEK
jgi:DNA-binding transcriptional regulator GbsR (MarR family)